MTTEAMPEGMEKPFDPRDETEANALRMQNAEKMAAGEPIATRKRRNHWRFDNSPERFNLDDDTGEYIEFRPMDGGAKAEFERRTAKDMWMQSGGRQNMRLSIDQARDRDALFEVSIVGWYMERPTDASMENWESVPFSKQHLRQWLEAADPTTLTELEDAIRKSNPWMINEQSIEDLEAARDELEEQIRAKKDQEGE